jgi:hypothetical protein
VGLPSQAKDTQKENGCWILETSGCRVVIEPTPVPHTVTKTRLVPRRVVSPSHDVAQVVVAEEHYEVTEMRLVDVPRTVVEQEEREVLATVYDLEQRVVPVNAELSRRPEQGVYPLDPLAWMVRYYTYLDLLRQCCAVKTGPTILCQNGPVAPA